MNEENQLHEKMTETKYTLPLIFLRGMVMFPEAQMPIHVGRKFTVGAIRKAREDLDPRIVVVTQKKAEQIDQPGQDDAYEIATICSLQNSVLLPDGSAKIFVEGLERFKIEKMYELDDIPMVDGCLIYEKIEPENMGEIEKKRIITLLTKANKMTDEFRNILTREDNRKKLIDYTCGIAAKVGQIDASVNERVKARQEILEEGSLEQRFLMMVRVFEQETNSQ